METTKDVPLQWSVRNPKNIRWAQPLPAGGQSGITIWENRLFLTINPPLDTPALVELRAQGQAAKADFEARFAKALSMTKNEDAAGYQSASQTLEQAEKALKQLLSQKNGKITRAMRKSPEWKAFEKAQKDYNSLIYKQDRSLPKLMQTADKLLAEMPSPARSPDLILLCVDADTGQVLWEKLVEGQLPTDYNYGFSDSTTPTPITDGEFVWAINASGGMACFTFEGEPVWNRKWHPTTGGKPFNKQFDSIIHGDLILNVEPPQADDPERNAEWNYLHAFDKRTGLHRWTSKDALTHYNMPSIGTHVSGKTAVLMARGGPHGVPERPVGLSLVDIETGESIWTWAAPGDNKVTGWGSLNAMHWDTEKTFWITPAEIISIDTKNGSTLSTHSITKFDVYNFDEASGKYQLTQDKKTGKIDWEWYTNFRVGNKVYYLLRHSPFLACHDLDTGKTIHLELPREFNDNGTYIWKTPQSNDGLNSRDQRHARDARTLGDGFQRIFLGTPTRINQYLYFTNALGMVYVIDTSKDEFGPASVAAVNDLGKRGETWTVNSLSYSNGYIYHRTLKELIRIGK